MLRTLSAVNFIAANPWAYIHTQSPNLMFWVCPLGVRSDEVAEYIDFSFVVNTVPAATASVTFENYSALENGCKPRKNEYKQPSIHKQVIILSSYVKQSNGLDQLWSSVMLCVCSSGLIIFVKGSWAGT